VPFNFDQIRFLSDDYLSGTKYFWQDGNGNEQYEPEERGRVYHETGGGAHRMNKSSLRQPGIGYMDIDLNLRLGNWYFGTIFQYRQFHNTWTVEYSEQPEDIGFYRDVTNFNTAEEAYYLLPDQDFDFVVRGFNRELMEQGAEKELGFLWRDPYYFGTTINIQNETPRLFFNISFTAYMAVGWGPMGNGFMHNNLNVLSESLANPNTYVRYLGRLDSDRAYLVRGLASYKWTDRFSTSLRVKYKDGQPINLFDTRLNEDMSGNNQVAIWNNQIKGTNPFTGEFGQRESGFWNYDINLTYRADIGSRKMNFSMDIYNLLDVASTLNNYTFTPGNPGERFTMEVQIPRGFILTAEYFF
jgi:hypothetical protein